MAMKSKEAVFVTTFVDPHIFWILEKCNIRKKKLVEQELKANIAGKPHLVRAEVGELLQPPKAVYQELPTFSSGVIQIVQELINHADDIFFYCVEEKDDIYFGNLELVRDDTKAYDLIDVMVDKKRFGINEEMFQKAFQMSYQNLQENFVDVVKHTRPCTTPNKRTPSIILQELTDSLSDCMDGGLGVRCRKLPVSASTGNKEYITKWMDQANPKSPNTGMSLSESDIEDAPQISPFRQFSKTDCSSVIDVWESASQTGNESVTKIEPNSTFVGACAYSSRNEEKKNTSDVSVKANLMYETLFGGLKGPNANTSVNDSDDTADSKQLIAVDSSNTKADQQLKPITCNANIKLEKFKEDLNIDNGKVVTWSDFGDTESKARGINMIPSGMSLQKETEKVARKNSVTKSPNSTRLSFRGSINSSRRSSINNSSKSYSKASSVNEPLPKSTLSISVKQNEPKLQESSSSVASSKPICHVNRNEIAHEKGTNKCSLSCQCEQCKAWNTDEAFFNENKDFVDMVKEKRLVAKPPLLLKTEGEQAETTDIQSVKFGLASKTDRATAPNVLVHGYFLPKPADKVSVVPFDMDIHKALTSLNFHSTKTIQAYVWPSIMRHMNVCIVSGPKSGKTMAYLPAVCSYVVERQERYPDLPTREIGPIAVVLCPGSHEAEEVVDIAGKLFQRSKSYRRGKLALGIPPLDRTRLEQFKQQCDMLVVTPKTLITLLEARIISFKRLCHFVIENCDKTLATFPNEVERLLKVIQEMLDHRIRNYSVQLIVSTETWTQQVEHLMKRLRSTPVICIGAYLEAALYGRNDIKMHFLQTERKKSMLADMLKDTSHIYKSVVIFNTEAEIEEATQYLLTEGVAMLVVDSSLKREQINDLEAVWISSAPGKYLVLLCTDAIYRSDINIRDATLLVHYSLPPLWTHFSRRFSCLIDSYKSPLITSNTDQSVRCQTHVFVDERCDKPFVRFVQFLQRMNCYKIPSDFMRLYKKVIRDEEKQKVSLKATICSSIKLFGNCSDLKCAKRHIFSPDLDVNEHIPKCGIVKFKMIHILDVTSYAVKLLEHIDVDGNVHNLSDKFVNFEANLKAAFQLKRYVTEPVIGNWYAMLKGNEYSRCKVLKIVEIERITKKPSVLKVLALDTGVEEYISINVMFELPNEFKKITPRAVEVYLANMVPPDQDDRWSTDCKHRLKFMLKSVKEGKENTYFEGRILLQVGNILWLENIRLLEKLSTINQTVTHVNFRNTLETKNYINYCEKPLQQLYKLCEKAKLVIPDYNVNVKFANTSRGSLEQIEPQWAFLDGKNYDEVYFCSGISPDEFYVRPKKFAMLLEQLQSDIQLAISKPFYPDKFDIEVGKCYLVKDPGGNDYSRVKVTSVEDDMVDCFFVDFGDTCLTHKSELKFLSDDFIAKLPFQVIECRLFGVQRPSEHWPEPSTDVFYKYCFEPGTDFYQTLYVSIVKTENPVISSWKKCAVLLVDWYTEQPVVINNYLISERLAEQMPAEPLEDIPILEKNAEFDDDSVSSIDDDGHEYSIAELQEKRKRYMEKNHINNDDENKCESGQSQDDSKDVWDIEINDAELFLKQLLLGGDVESTAPKSPVPTEYFSPMTAAPPSDHHIPEVIWHQTNRCIKMKIMLPGIIEYDIKIRRGIIFDFRTIYDEKQYRLYLQLFSAVNKTYKISPSGQHLGVTLTKGAPMEWPRLVMTTDRMRNIKSDLSKLYVPEPKAKPFLKIDVETEYSARVEMVYGSDEDYSESDLEFQAFD